MKLGKRSCHLRLSSENLISLGIFTYGTSQKISTRSARGRTAATGWQQHSVRGALVNLKNKDKQPVESEKRDGTRYYLIKQAEKATA
jgi:hypothetical protein